MNRSIASATPSSRFEAVGCKPAISRNESGAFASFFRDDLYGSYSCRCNAGFEGNYFFTPQYGAGGFVRYVGGNVDFPSVEDFEVGGIQVGVRVRIRF